MEQSNCVDQTTGRRISLKFFLAEKKHTVFVCIASVSWKKNCLPEEDDSEAETVASAEEGNGEGSDGRRRVFLRWRRACVRAFLPPLCVISRIATEQRGRGRAKAKTGNNIPKDPAKFWLDRIELMFSLDRSHRNQTGPSPTRDPSSSARLKSRRYQIFFKSVLSLCKLACFQTGLEMIRSWNISVFFSRPVPYSIRTVFFWNVIFRFSFRGFCVRLFQYKVSSAQFRSRFRPVWSRSFSKINPRPVFLFMDLPNNMYALWICAYCGRLAQCSIWVLVIKISKLQKCF